MKKLMTIVSSGRTFISMRRSLLGARGGGQTVVVSGQSGSAADLEPIGAIRLLLVGCFWPTRFLGGSTGGGYAQREIGGWGREAYHDSYLDGRFRCCFSREGREDAHLSCGMGVY